MGSICRSALHHTHIARIFMTLEPFSLNGVVGERRGLFPMNDIPSISAIRRFSRKVLFHPWLEGCQRAGTKR